MNLLQNSLLDKDILISFYSKNLEYYKLELINNYIGKNSSLDLVYTSYQSGNESKTIINSIYYLKHINNKFIINFYKYKIIIKLYKYIEEYLNDYSDKHKYCCINNKIIFVNSFLQSEGSIYIYSSEFEDMRVRLNDIIKRR